MERHIVQSPIDSEIEEIEEGHIASVLWNSFVKHSGRKALVSFIIALVKQQSYNYHSRDGQWLRKIPVELKASS